MSTYLILIKCKPSHWNKLSLWLWWPSLYFLQWYPTILPSHCQHSFEDQVPHLFLPLSLSGRTGIILSLPAFAPLCLSIHKLWVVRTITHHRFELESPNLHQACILGYFWLVLKMGVNDLDLQGHLATSTQNSRKQHSAFLYTDLGRRRGVTCLNVLLLKLEAEPWTWR